MKSARQGADVLLHRLDLGGAQVGLEALAVLGRLPELASLLIGTTGVLESEKENCRLGNAIIPVGSFPRLRDVQFSYAYENSGVYSSLPAVLSAFGKCQIIRITFYGAQTAGKLQILTQAFPRLRQLELVSFPLGVLSLSGISAPVLRRLSFGSVQHSMCTQVQQSLAQCVSQVQSREVISREVKLSAHGPVISFNIAPQPPQQVQHPMVIRIQNSSRGALKSMCINPLTD